MKRPAFFLACAVLAGAVAGRAVVAPPAAGLGAFLLLLATGITLFLRWSAPAAAEHENHRRRAVLTRVLLGALFCLALFQQNEIVRRERLAEKQASLLQSEGPHTFRATVASEPSRQGRDGRVVAILRDVAIPEFSGDGLRAPGETNVAKETPAPIRRFAARVELSLSPRAAEGLGEDLPVPGERLEISGTLRSLPEAAHPDLFDYGAYLRTLGVGARLSVWDPEDVRRADGEGSKAEASLYRFLMRWRRSTLKRLDLVLPPDRSAVMRAMLLGETGGFEAGTRDAFVRTGLVHLLSVSGVHTGMLALIVFGVCRILQAPPRLAAWVTILLLAVYCVLVGFRAPVVRASIMAGCLAVPVLARRAVDTLTALSIAAFFTALFNPLAPFRSDFQFSYACVFGLVTLRPALLELLAFSFRDRPYSVRRLLYFHNQWIAGGLAVVVAAQLAVIPLLSIYFHQVSLIGFLANLVMVPFAGVLLACGWAFSLLGALAPAAEAWLGAILSGVSGVFLAVARVFADLPGAAMWLPAFPWWAAGVYYAVLFHGPHMRMARAPGALESRRARMLVRLAAVGALLAWVPFAARASWLGGEPSDQFRVAMLDVGQGDCFILRLPNGKTMAIDAGERWAAQRILQYLRSQGVGELAALLLTHSDDDHIGGAPDLIDAGFVDRLLVGPNRSDTENQERLEATIRRHGVPVARVARGDRLQGGGMRLAILGPSLETNPGIDSNAQSVVLLAELGEMTFLFMGDAEAPTETDLVEAYGRETLEAEVLKVGHHGSRNASSPAFLDAVRPRVVLISAGRRNPHGHPSPDVLDRLEGLGAEVWNTQVHGTVELRTDGRRLWVRPVRALEEDLAIPGALRDRSRESATP